jgi:hypothetical protein
MHQGALLPVPGRRVRWKKLSFRKWRLAHYAMQTFVVCGVMSWCWFGSDGSKFWISATNKIYIVGKLSPVPWGIFKNIIVLDPSPIIEVACFRRDFTCSFHIEEFFAGKNASFGGEKKPSWWGGVIHFWKIKIIRYFSFSKLKIKANSAPPGGRVSSIFQLNEDVPTNNSIVLRRINNTFASEAFYMDKRAICCDQGVPTEADLTASRDCRPSSEKQRQYNAYKAGDTEFGLKGRPPNSIFGRLRHTPLLTQVIILAAMSAVTVCVIIIGIGFLLRLLGNWRRRWLGFWLLLLGLLGWCGIVALSAAMT